MTIRRGISATAIRVRARIEGLSEELLARAMVRGTMDLIADYALPIPLTVTSEMLGIPTADQHRFNRCSCWSWPATRPPSTSSAMGSWP